MPWFWCNFRLAFLLNSLFRPITASQEISSGLYGTKEPQDATNASIPISVWPSSTSAGDTSSESTLVSTSSTPSLSIQATSTACSNDTYSPRYITLKQKYVGLEVTVASPCSGYCPKSRNSTEWDYWLKIIRTGFPSMNTVRLPFIWSEKTGYANHLVQIQSALENNNFSVVATISRNDTATIWAGAAANMHLGALATYISNYGCDSLAAVSVDENSLNDLVQKDDSISSSSRSLVEFMSSVRHLLRATGCCDTPVVTALDFAAWNSSSDSRKFVTDLISASDSFVLNRIIPYTDSSVTTMDGAITRFWTVKKLMDQFASQLNRSVWPITGHPRRFEAPKDISPPNRYFHNGPNATDSDDNAEEYWNRIGCWLLLNTPGTGNSGFYLTDWGKDAKWKSPPSGDFGLFEANGSFFGGRDLRCQHFDPNSVTTA